MSRIDAGNTSSLATSRLATTSALSSESLRRLSAGVQLQRSSGADAVEVSDAASAQPGSTATAAAGGGVRPSPLPALDAIGGLLDQIGGLVNAAAYNSRLTLDQKEQIQSQIDASLEQIDHVAAASNFSHLPFFGGHGVFKVTGLSPQVYDHRIVDARINAGQVRNVDVVVTQSAQAGGFLLSLGGPSLDLGASSQRFILEIKGTKGVRELSFASGTTVAAIADAINTYANFTGVAAKVSNAALRLTSDGVGAESFVSVKVIDDGGLASWQGSGIFNLRAHDFNRVDASSRRLFNDPGAANGFTDEGQSLVGTINGVRAYAKGDSLSIDTLDLAVQVHLSGDGPGPNSQRVGAFRAFTLTGVQGNLTPQPGHNATTSQLGHVFSMEDGVRTEYSLADLEIGGPLNVINGDLLRTIEVVQTAHDDLATLRNRLTSFGAAATDPTSTPTLDASTEISTSADASEIARIVRQAALASTKGFGAGVIQTGPEKILSLISPRRSS